MITVHLTKQQAGILSSALIHSAHCFFFHDKEQLKVIEALLNRAVEEEKGAGQTTPKVIIESTPGGTNQWIRNAFLGEKP